jgi:hypothetical protein
MSRHPRPLFPSYFLPHPLTSQILPFDETAYLAVATFGASFFEGCRAARLAANRLIPHMPAMHGRCAALIFGVKLSAALFCTGIAALVLHFNPAYAPADFAGGRTLSSLPLAVFFVFGLSYLFASVVLAPLEMAAAAAAYSWALDFEQNVEALGRSPDETWLMAAEVRNAPTPLDEVHGFMLDEYDGAEAQREERARASRRSPAKSRVQLRGARGARNGQPPSGARAGSPLKKPSPQRAAAGRAGGGHRSRATLEQSEEDTDGEDGYTNVSPRAPVSPASTNTQQQPPRRRRPGTVVPGEDD